MKKFGFLTPFIVAMVMVICFVQCQKERPLGFKITCYYEGTDSLINNKDKGKFYIDTSKYLMYDSVYARYNYCDTTLARLCNGQIVDGVAKFEKLRYPALLRVVLATDTIYNEDSTARWTYRDTIEVKVEEENIIDKKINKPAEAKAYLSKYFIQ